MPKEWIDSDPHMIIGNAEQVRHPHALVLPLRSVAQSSSYWSHAGQAPLVLDEPTQGTRTRCVPSRAGRPLRPPHLFVFLSPYFSLVQLVQLMHHSISPLSYSGETRLRNASCECEHLLQLQHSLSPFGLPARPPRLARLALHLLSTEDSMESLDRNCDVPAAFNRSSACSSRLSGSGRPAEGSQRTYYAPLVAACRLSAWRAASSMGSGRKSAGSSQDRRQRSGTSQIRLALRVTSPP